MKVSVAKFALTILACSTATNAFAEGEWSAGGVALGSSAIYVGEDAKYRAFPYLSYKNNKFALDAREGVSYKIAAPKTDWGAFGSFTVFAAPRLAPSYRKEEKDNFLDFDLSADAGFKGQIGWAFLFADYDYKADILGVHEGTEASLSVGARQFLGPVAVSLKGGYRYRDANLGQYLYGIYDEDATAERPAYRPKDELSPFASLAAFYPLSEKVSIIATMGYEDLGAYKESPVIENTEKTSFMVGAVYKF